MEIVPLTPLTTSSLLWRPRPSTWVLTVVCKATFRLEPGQSTLAPRQDPVIDADEFWDDSEKRSLRFANEVVPTKPRAEVLLVGHAFAPGGQAVRSLTTRMIISDVDKSIEIHLDRHFGHDGAVHDGNRFSRMPIVYERAAGGPDLWNPVGVVPGARDGYGRIQLPNLQIPGTHIASPGDITEPVGYGPLAPGWPVRSQKLGGRTGVSFLHDLRAAPLPEGLDYVFFQAAPLDQRLDVLRDGERILLENLHPSHPRLHTALPGIRPRAFVEGRAGGPSVVEMRADTLCIDTDRGLCTLVFRGLVPLAHAAEPGRILIAMEQGTQSLSHAEVEQIAREHGAPRGKERPAAGPTWSASDESEEVGQTLFVGFDSPPPATATLPFASTAGAMAPAAAATPGLKASGGLPFAAQQGEVVPPVPEAPAEVRPPPLVMSSGGARSAANDSPWALGPPVREDASVPLTPPVAIAPASAEVAAPGVLGISNVAAARSEWSPGQPQNGASGPAASAPAEAQARPVPRAGDPRDAVLLVWFDPSSMRRFRRHKPFHEALDQAENESGGPELDDVPLGDTAADVEDRRDVLSILTRALSTDAPGVVDAMERSVSEHGIVVPPIALCAGELTIPFDAVETLQTTVATITPLSAGDENLKATLQSAREILGLPNLQSAPAVAEGMNRRVLEAFGRAKRAVTVESIEAQTERALLEQRAYQRRRVFGGKHLRGLLTMHGAKEPIPTYLPEALAEQIPLYTRFRVRLVAEVRAAEDQYEAHPAALRVLAVARVLERAKRERA